MIVGEQQVCLACLLNPQESDLDGYELLEELGHGGMGVVFRARPPKGGQEVAIKLISETTDPALQERFAREAKILEQLSHPNIVKFDHFGVRGEDTYLVMELVAGKSLTKCLPVSTRRAIEIAVELCDALSYAHDRGVIHRDIKPSNVLITPTGQVKLVDFGLARPLAPSSGQTLTATNVSVGTPYFAAPETMLHAKPSVQLDIYSLGILLYNSITGSYPVGHYEPLSGPLGVVTRKATAQRPENRYSSIAEMRRALVELEDAGSEIATVAGKHKPPKSKSGRRLAITLGAVVAVALGVGSRFLIGGASSGEVARTDNAESVEAVSMVDLSTIVFDASAGNVAFDAGSQEPGADGAGLASLSSTEPNPRAKPGRVRTRRRADDPVVPQSTASPGHLTVHARPWAEVRVDDGPVRRAEPPKGASFQLSVGRHVVRLRNPSSERTVERSVQIRSGKREILRVDLR